VSCGESEGVLGTFYSNHDRLVEANPAAREASLKIRTTIPSSPTIRVRCAITVRSASSCRRTSSQRA